jgi:hypothetical protein
MPTNIKFNYLYRDAGNYKQFGNIVLSNLNNIALDLIEDIVRGNLIDGEFSMHINGEYRLYFSIRKTKTIMNGMSLKE